MKLKEFLANLNEFVKENPEALELDVITSKDDEGNGYNEVVYTPSIGNFEDKDFTSKSSMEEEGYEDMEINAVCIN
jgi:hypothetical protein